ncbi:MAG: hypothetical protein JWQ72_4035 [Polaromonas sp.]|nr:hypothetical protein [Polaromonas sp.]
MFYLKRNLPGPERALRLGAGLVVACAVLFWQPVAWLLWAGLAVAATLALTGLVGFCPACAMLGRRPVKGIAK